MTEVTGDRVKFQMKIICCQRAQTAVIDLTVQVALLRTIKRQALSRRLGIDKP